MPTLHLGVVDVPYANAPRKAGSKAKSGTQTTGDVATWLEDKYGVMQTFFELHGDDIAQSLAKSYQGALETVLMGGPTTSDPFGTAQSEIEHQFRNFLLNREMDGRPGVPTLAAIERASGKRRSNRFKRKRATNAAPVSFIDTSLYENSFTDWLD
jgi:hypothetical protein